MRRRSPARWLAPLALVTCAVAIYAVVDQELLGQGDSKKTTSTNSSTGEGTDAATTKRKTTKKAKTYTIKAGDSLSVIAAKTGVSMSDLQDANPKVEPSALHPGQKLKLPR
jgi:LysM repeat protein